MKKITFAVSDELYERLVAVSGSSTSIAGHPAELISIALVDHLAGPGSSATREERGAIELAEAESRAERVSRFTTADG